MSQADRVYCSLAVAGIAVTMTSNDAPLIEHFARRYAPFLVSNDTPTEVIIEILLDPQFRSPPLASTDDTGVVFQHQSGQFATAHSAGQIDTASGRVTITLADRQFLADIDYCVRIVHALWAFRSGGMLFHGAGIVRNGHACLFFGHSGSGKTTTARLSIGDRVLNDDLVLLMPQDNGWLVHATPFWNPTQFGRPEPGSAPLAAMLRLVQSPYVALEAMSPAHALAELLSCVPVMSGDAASSHVLLERGLRLLDTIPIYRLHFLPDASFWRVVEPLLPPGK